MDKLIENLNYKNILNQAINHAKSIGIDSLDLTDGSIGDVEAILGFFHENSEKLNEESIHNLAILYGVYIGEVMLNNYLKERDFNWYFDIDMHIIKSETVQISVITKCYNRLKNGEIDNVLDFYRAIIEYVVENKINENVNRHINVELSDGNVYEAVDNQKADELIDLFIDSNSDYIKFDSHDGYLMIIKDDIYYRFEVNIKEESLLSKQINEDKVREIVYTYYCKIHADEFLDVVEEFLINSQIKC